MLHFVFFISFRLHSEGEFSSSACKILILLYFVVRRTSSFGNITSFHCFIDHDLGQHAIFAENTAVSSTTHPCPYIAYFGPIHPSSSTSSGTIPDGSNFNNQWSAQSVQGEIPSSYAFPAMDVHYNSWEHHASPFATSSRIGGADQSLVPSVTQRTARTSSEIPRPGSFMHPLLSVSHRLVCGEPHHCLNFLDKIRVNL